jgi:hypothetical protein
MLLSLLQSVLTSLSATTAQKINGVERFASFFPLRRFLMKHLLRTVTKAFAVLSISLSTAHATVIEYTSSTLGGSRWRANYTINNDTLGSPLEEFTVFFNENLFANLADAVGPVGWDLLLIQPDTGIPATGYFDALALTGGIAVGHALAGFSLTFDYLGVGAPEQHAFSILNPTTFDELDRGMAQEISVPTPGTLPLLLAGICSLVGWQCRRQGGAQ